MRASTGNGKVQPSKKGNTDDATFSYFFQDGGGQGSYAALLLALGKDCGLGE